MQEADNSGGLDGKALSEVGAQLFNGSGLSTQVVVTSCQYVQRIRQTPRHTEYSPLGPGSARTTLNYHYKLNCNNVFARNRRAVCQSLLQPRS